MSYPYLKDAGQNSNLWWTTKFVIDMVNTSDNNKRIAKNTLFLYVRMLVTLGVSLFTVRVVLQTLGVEDYGIYNVVAGFVTSFSFIANTTSSAIQRFLSFCIGQDDWESYHKYFVGSFFLFSALALIAFLLLETFGLWFLHEKMVIPVERIEAANWVFHSAMVVLFFSFLSIPYNAVIISNERMNLFAYLSISDVLLKLFIVYLLKALQFDHLKTYSVLLACTGLINFMLYKLLAVHICKEVRLALNINYSHIRHLLGFSCWNLIGSLAGICRNQGINVLQNLYFGPIYNTACGISFQIYNAINGFASNFIMAANPQIIKLYAKGENEALTLLVERSSKIAFSLLSLIAFPFLTLMPYVLDLWLGDVPSITILFARLILANMLVECVSMPLMTLAQASGRIRPYQLAVGGILILNVPIAWLLLKYLHAESFSTFISLIVINIVALWIRLVILHRIANLNVSQFVKNVLTRWGLLLMVCFIGFGLSLRENVGIQIIITCIFTFIIIPLIILFVVFSKSDRNAVMIYIKSKLKK